ncbi:MAG: MarR family transcriptional regulator [Bacteroidota bacterium]
MSQEEKAQVDRFINGLQDMILGMQRVDSTCMEAFGPITKRDFGLCVMLGQQKRMIMREVAEFLQVPMSTATGIIDKLIEKGLVKRDYSPEDRRIVMVELSKQGCDIYDMLKEKLFLFGQGVLEEFDPEEKEQFIGYMVRAAESIWRIDKVL